MREHWVPDHGTGHCVLPSHVSILKNSLYFNLQVAFVCLNVCTLAEGTLYPPALCHRNTFYLKQLSIDGFRFQGIAVDTVSGREGGIPVMCCRWNWSFCSQQWSCCTAHLPLLCPLDILEPRGTQKTPELLILRPQPVQMFMITWEEKPLSALRAWWLLLYT